MQNLLVTLFYGPKKIRQDYYPFFKEWLDHHYKLGIASRIRIVTDTDEQILPPEYVSVFQVVKLSYSNYHDVLRKDQPFDVKGALMCSALIHFSGQGFLFLDSDAFLMRPEDLDHDDLKQSIGLGMSKDLNTEEFFHYPLNKVRKRCAGTAFFGAEGDRNLIVETYKKSWKELYEGSRIRRIPWLKITHRLMEQYAWSLASHKLNLPKLPDSWNYPPHIAQWSENIKERDAAHVHHLFGHSKWKKIDKVPPPNV